MAKTGKLYIGTSGWAYKDWGKKFFPKDVPQRLHLQYLAGRFNSVELNASFYRLQSPTSYEKWRKETPADFRFAIKVSRYVTHIKRLTKVEKYWPKFYETTVPMGPKRGPYLVQLPPSFRANEETVARLDNFLTVAKKSGRGLRFAVELRNQSWFDDETNLKPIIKHKVALVFPNSAKWPDPPRIDPASYVYYRLHGPRKLFASGYKDDELKVWAKDMQKYLRKGKDVYVYFNNDTHAHAPANAELLQKFLKFRR